MNFFLQQFFRKERNKLFFPIEKKADYIFEKRKLINEGKADKLLALEYIFFIIQFESLKDDKKFIKQYLYIKDLHIYIPCVSEYCKIGSKFPVFNDPEWESFNELKFKSWKNIFEKKVKKYVGLSIVELFEKVYSIEEEILNNKLSYLFSVKLKQKKSSIIGFRSYFWNEKNKKEKNGLINVILLLIEILNGGLVVYLMIYFLKLIFTSMPLLNNKFLFSLISIVILTLIYISMLKILGGNMFKKNIHNIEEYEKRRENIIGLSQKGFQI